MRCNECGHESTGKFCGKCGATITEVLANQEVKRTCPSCGHTVSGKFCGKCGLNLESFRKSDQIEEATPFQRNPHHKGFILWNVLPGQVAAKIQLDTLDDFSEAKGVIIHEGTSALIYDRGQFVTELKNGVYDFDPAQIQARAGSILLTREGGLFGGLRGAGRFLVNMLLGRPAQAEDPHPDQAITAGMITAVRAERNITIVLARDDVFPLFFQFEQMPTRDLRSDLYMETLVEISDLKALYRTFLVDNIQLSAERLAEAIRPSVESILADAVREISPADIDHNISLYHRLTSLFQTSPISDIPINISTVKSVSASRAEIDRLRQLAEELYVSEKELEQLQRYNDFQNRLRLVENRARVDEARSNADVRRALQEVNKDEQLTADDLSKFEMVLAAQRRIREGQSEDEVQAALAEVRKSGLLREEGLRALEREIKEREKDQQLMRMHMLDMLEVAQRLDSDRERLAAREELESRAQELEIQKRRREYETQIAEEGLKVSAERVRAEFEDERRAKKLEVEKQEQLGQLDILKQAQSIRMEREQADHDRSMETERQKLDHERAMQREQVERFKGMTADEILAANPNMSDAQAMAIAEKAKAEAATASGEDRAIMMEAQQDKMMDFVTEMARMNADIAAGRASDRDKELERSRKDASEAGNRAVNLVNNTVSAVYNSKSVKRDSSKALKKCIQCCADLPDESAFCEVCGTKQG